MKAGVIGYGVQGSAVVSILEKTYKIRRCEKVSDPGKVRAFCADVADILRMNHYLEAVELFLTCSRRSFRKVY